jgi:hypothetical protein
VRLIMAPNGDGSRFNIQLAAAVVKGMTHRVDAGEYLAQVTNELGGLPHDHLALRVFLKRMLPVAWPDGAPKEFTDRLDTERMEPATKTALLAAVQQLGA